MSEQDIEELLQGLAAEKVPQPLLASLRQFLQSYWKAAEEGGASLQAIKAFFVRFFHLIVQNIKNPPQYQPFHKAIRAPFDYRAFSLDFMRPILDFGRSQVKGKENLAAIAEAVSRNENVILFANHQTETDPQIIALLIEKNYPSLANDMIFVAGHRVTTDVLAIPFSLGTNLLCIYSKKYIDFPPEKKEEKIKHNQRTMKVMEELLREGGKCIYIAPSGGRDRVNEQGIVEVAPFDPQSIEMLHLVARQAKTKTHFHTLALSTYNLLPPPSTVNKEIGELRSTTFTPAHLFFGPEISMEADEDAGQDKKEVRRKRAQRILETVVEEYHQLT